MDRLKYVAIIEKILSALQGDKDKHESLLEKISHVGSDIMGAVTGKGSIDSLISALPDDFEADAKSALTVLQDDTKDDNAVMQILEKIKPILDKFM